MINFTGDTNSEFFVLKWTLSILTLIIHVDIWMKPIVCCFLAQVGQGSTSLCVKVIKESHQPGIPETCISTLTQGHHGTCGYVY